MGINAISTIVEIVWLGGVAGGGRARGQAGPVWFPPVSPGLGGEQGWWMGGGGGNLRLVFEVVHVQQPNPKVENVFYV